jgi:MYXO-CTERM domain-containing protein
MKMKAPLVAALMLGLPAMSNAFTLDAVGYEGSELSLDPVTVFVPGYGDLVFEAASGSTLVVNSDYENDNGFGAPALSFDSNESVKITFKGADPMNVDFDFVGLSADETFLVEKDATTPQTYFLTLKGCGDGAGLYSISWCAQSVPEPSSAMLGLIGAGYFALRRRR